MSNDTIRKTILVALGVCLVCSILVSTAAVLLHPRQKKNKELEKIVNVLQVSGLYKKGQNPEQVFKEKFEPVFVHLKTGEVLPEAEYNEVLNPAAYDTKKAAKDPAYGAAISTGDIARIKRKPKFMLVYYVKEEGKRRKIILPVYGKGLWSTLYGFLALDMDLVTIAGFTVYDHGETPGMGGEVGNPSWQSLWQGKVVEFDTDNDLMLKVIKGKVDLSRPDAKYKIDGLSGATLTTVGVNNMIKFWLGDCGYGPFIRKLKEERDDG
jgi:Na+-transporting NADH:ubiquinone oxidoreductase subunit C